MVTVAKLDDGNYSAVQTLARRQVHGVNGGCGLKTHAIRPTTLHPASLQPRYDRAHAELDTAPRVLLHALLQVHNMILLQKAYALRARRE